MFERGRRKACCPGRGALPQSDMRTRDPGQCVGRRTWAKERAALMTAPGTLDGDSGLAQLIVEGDTHPGEFPLQLVQETRHLCQIR